MTIKTLLFEWQLIASKKQSKNISELIRIINELEKHDYPSKEPRDGQKGSVVKMLKALIKDARLHLVNQSN